MTSQSQIEAMMFKKVDDGYIYRAPAPWLFGKSRHYRVNDAQKAEIAQILKRTQPDQPVVIGLILGLLIVAVVTAWAYLLFRDSDPSITDYLLLLLLVAVVILVFVQIVAWVQLYRLKPILAHLQRSNERISFRDLRNSARKPLSLADTIRLGAIQAFLCAVSMFNAGSNLAQSIAKGRGSFSLYVFLFIAVLSGSVAFTYFRRAMSKAKTLENEG